MRISLQEVEQLLVAAAAKHVSPPEAAYFAECYIETHLRKYPRMNPLEEAVADVKVWRDLPGRRPETLVDKEGIAILDLQGLAPSLWIKRIHDKVERKARQHGVAALGFRNTAGITTLNMWSFGLATRDLIGISMVNGGTECAVPYGGRRGVMGTNPLAYAIPTADQPVVLDMATTEIPFFEVKNAKDKGVPLRENVALGPDGVPTTDPQQALTDDGVANLLPMGSGFKGYGILFLIEILTGPLVRSLLSTEQTSGWHPPEYGGLLIGFDISSFADLDGFKQSVSGMCDVLRGMPAAPGFEGVAVPGDRGQAKAARARAAGEIEIPDKIAQDLRALAG